MVEHPVPQRLQDIEGALAHLGASTCWPPQKDGRLSLIVAVGPAKHNVEPSS